VFVPKDDVGVSGSHDPTVGAANIRALIGDALVAGVVGPFKSNVAKAEMPIANQAPIALISPANTNQCLTKDTPESGCTGSANLNPTLLRPARSTTSALPPRMTTRVQLWLTTSKRQEATRRPMSLAMPIP